MKDNKENVVKFLFVSILTDFGFKITFGNDKHSHFLIKSIQALIKSKVPIVSISMAPQVREGETKDSKGGVYDVTCVDKDGNVYIVELQMYGFKAFIQRAKFYAYHRFNQMVKKGSDFDWNIKENIYAISFLNGSIFKDTEQYHHFCCLRSEEGRLMDNQITHVIIELNKFDKTEEECITDLDKLLFFMKNIGTITEKEQLPKFAGEDWLQPVLNNLDIRNLTKEELAQYEISRANASMYNAYQKSMGRKRNYN